MHPTFRPPLILDNHAGDAAKNFPIEIRIFSHLNDRSPIYKLRYQAFLADRLITAGPEENFADRFDDLPSSRTIGAFHQGTCVASLRLAFGMAKSAEATMPSQELFPEVETLYGGSDCKIVEFTRMAVAPALTNLSFRTTLYATMVRTGMILANAGDAKIGIVAVKPKTAAFYKSMCGFKFVAGPRPYPFIDSDVVLLAREFVALDGARQSRSAFFQISDHEIAEARAIMDHQEIQNPTYQ